MPAAITPVTINSYSVVSKTAYKGGTKPEQKQSASDFKQVSAAELRGRSSRKQSQVLNQLGSKAASLESFIKSTQFPSGTSAPMFRTASVSNPDKATASAADGANTAVYTLDITRPASAQTR
ncbi:MAG: hypothetical protein GY868_06035, partial [Deltaproteobacteria bacterium]|nr:hypothetical protein [Deltaproteobacteria bacterium]